MSENFKKLLRLTIPLELLLLIGFLVFYKTHTTDFVNVGVLGFFSGIIFLQACFSGKIFLPKLSGALFIIFLILITLSSHFSSVYELSIVEVVYYLALFFIFIVGVSLSTDKILTELFWKSLFWSSVFVILYYFTDYLRYDFNQMEIRHFAAPLYWHNQMAAYLSFLIPFSFLNFLTKGGIPKILYGLSSTFLIIELLFTYSRAGWLSLLVGFIIVFTLKKDIFIKSNLIKRLSVTVGLVLIISAVLLSPVRTRLISIVDPQTSSSTPALLRSEAAKSAAIMISQYPLVGVGPGTFGQAFVSYQQLPWLFAYDTHNHYLQIAAESGLITAVLFMLFIGSLIRDALTRLSKKTDLPSNIITMTLTISLLTAGFHNFFDVDWNWPVLGVLFSIGAGGIYINSKNSLLEFAKNQKIILSTLAVILLMGSAFLLTVGRITEEGIKSYGIANELSENILQKVLNRFPISYTAPLYLARLAELNDNHAQTNLYYDLAYSSNMYLGEGFFYKSIQSAKMNDFINAEMYIQKAIDIEAFARPEYYEQKARISILKDDENAARATLRDMVYEKFPINQSFLDFRYLYTATGFDKRLGQIYFYYADLLTDNGENDEAKSILYSALTHLDPANKYLLHLKNTLENEKGN